MNTREIDRLVAEKVMGWEVSIFKNINVVEAYTEYEETVIIGEDFSPTTDIQDAWLAAEKFEDIRLERNKSLKPSVRVDIWNPTMVRTFADTAPMAICLAALKAVGVELPEEN